MSTAAEAYQYVTLRCVPRVELEAFAVVGVVVYCHATDHLAAAWSVDEDVLQALDPELDVAALRRALRFVDAVCAGDPAVGAPGRAPVSQRFGFLKAPRSTVVQPGPVHGGLSHDVAGEPARLLRYRPGSTRDVAAEAQTGTSSTAPTA